MKIYLFSLLLFVANYSSFAQENKTFSAPHAPGQEVACTSITLLPGFSFNSSSGGSLDLRIDNSACSPSISSIDVPDAKASNAGTALDYNYIITITPTSETPSVNFDKGSLTVDRTIDKNVQTQISIQYFDGLGRPLETVQRGITPSNKDLVTYQGYDGLGRLDTAWLPSIGAGNGAFTTPNAIATADKALYKDAAPFGKPIYEDSPLNRIAEQYGAGADWYAQKKSVKTAYLTNTSSGNLVCALYSVGGTKALPSLKKVGNYDGYELYVTQTTDEDGNISFQFKDKLGQVVLSRKINNGINNDTYFVYDDFGNLTYVLPPLAADALNQDNATGWSDAVDALVKYAYLYRYDTRNRCIKKRIPGADWQYMVYDQTDQLIFSQDGEQRLKNEWSFTIPDAFHRRVLSGVCKNTDISFTKYDNISVRATLTGVASPYKGYTITGTTLTSPSLYLVNYYDNYSFNNKYGFPNWSCENIPDYGKQYTGSGGFESKGLLTGTATALLDSSNTFVYAANYYDNKQRVIQSKATNHLKGTEKVYLAYNFMGKPILKKHVSEVPSKTTITEVYSYTYDKALRLITTNYQVNSYPVICLEKNTYDELGRLLTSTKANQSKLNTSYAYNVRSMLSASSNSLFAEKLYYNETYSGASKAYNGNISAIAWTNASNRAYTLQYDNLSQLKAYSFLDKTTPAASFNVAYGFDKQGNMIKANNHTSVYAGNQLVQIDNYALGTFLYNKNGALSKDLSKGLINISYNYLNLPVWINQFESTGIGNVHYIYSAAGNKLQTKLASSLNLTTDYEGNTIYQNGSLKTVLFDGGYLEGGKFFFYLQDHLGNNRVVADAAGNAIQRNDYYPFGGLFASNTASSIQPYKYNGKEYCTELGLNQFDYSARWMDPRIGRFTTMDPLAEKYYSVSPYVYCHNNPMNRIDPSGMNDDIYTFDEDGNYKGSTPAPGAPVGRVEGKNGYDFSFADPSWANQLTTKDDNDLTFENSQRNPDNRKYNSVYLVPNKTIEKALDDSGVNNPAIKYLPNVNYLYAAFESRSRKMDYTDSQTERDITKDHPNSLYITNVNGHRMAHNAFNLGNFLWGAGMNRINVWHPIAVMGAEIDNVLNHGFELDSEDDQRSIFEGYNYNNK